MFVDFNNIKVTIEGDQVIFTEKEYGVGQLEYLELMISGHVNYIYYHYGDDPMTKIIISTNDYQGWIQNSIKNGINI